MSSPPRLVVILELEEHPVFRVEASYESDELRLRHWLERGVVRQRLFDSLADALDELQTAA